MCSLKYQAPEILYAEKAKQCKTGIKLIGKEMIDYNKIRGIHNYNIAKRLLTSDHH